MSEQNIHNAIFITADSCRYDTAIRADTPALDAIGGLRKTEVSGTYTYPSHHAMFLGNTPRSLDGDSALLENYDHIWRSSAARTKKGRIFESFDNDTIISHYQMLGYAVCGFGGVSFFDSRNPNNMLPRLFKDFTYFPNMRGLPKYTRHPTAFPLNHIDDISFKVDRSGSPYFIFINEPVTHVPYTLPGQILTKPAISLVDRLYAEHYSDHVHVYNGDDFPFSSEEIEFLKDMQVAGIEWMDKKIGELVQRLPDNGFPTICLVTADHGDEFGDEGRFGHAHFAKTVIEVPTWAGLLNPE